MERRRKRGRFGWCGYVRLLSALRRPTTIRGLVDAGWNDDTVWRIVPQLHARGIVSVAGWERHKNWDVPQYVFGRGAVDVPGPREPCSPRKASPELSVFCNFLDALTAPVSREMLREATGASRETLVAALKALKKAGFVHTAAWRQRTVGGSLVGGRPTEFFVLGPGPDAHRPTKSELGVARCKRFRARRQPPPSPMQMMARALAANETTREAA